LGVRRVLASRPAAALQSFRDLGIAISMDDYGTGQSTLSYLKQLPLNELKIDRSFVQFAHQSRADGALVRSTVDLAHELNLKVVAEGVEDEECLAFLRSIGCDAAQGYLISRPVPAMELAPLLSRDWAKAA
jgi:EAL domain-containing protein (putative c-di-GMP-specific phosphodiesterase class I)